MAIGEFTKEEGAVAKECLEEIMKAFPRSKAAGYIGEFNELALFIEAAIRKAPNESKAKE
jgi:hypothetical protein